MSTPKHTHLKIQEISSKYIGGKPPINIYTIGEELGINRDTIVEHISILKILDLVEFIDPKNEVITITDSGKMAKL